MRLPNWYVSEFYKSDIKAFQAVFKELGYSTAICRAIKKYNENNLDLLGIKAFAKGDEDFKRRLKEIVNEL